MGGVRRVCRRAHGGTEGRADCQARRENRACRVCRRAHRAVEDGRRRRSIRRDSFLLQRTELANATSYYLGCGRWWPGDTRRGIQIGPEPAPIEHVVMQRNASWSMAEMWRVEIGRPRTRRRPTNGRTKDQKHDAMTMADDDGFNDNITMAK